MNPYWEILIPDDEFNKFTAFMEDHGHARFTSTLIGKHYWIICYPSEGARVIAKLKFNITELPYYGVEIMFTDHPSS